MKNWRSYFYHILIFIFAQLAWIALISLWIYWYSSNYIIFSQAGSKLSPQMVPVSKNLFALVSGLILMVAISVGMSLLFRRLSIQYNLAGLYDNFIANVTHELKSPLASIQLYLETLARRELPREKQQEFLAIMLADAQRLNMLINAILEIPALEHKKIARHFQIVEAGPTLQRLAASAREQFQLDDQALVVQGEAPCRCVLDEEAMRIVLCNLIDNSIKYRHGSVRITITMSCSEKTLHIDCADKGIGWDESEEKKLFDKFYRIESERVPNVKGTGLGLYWVREIIKYHGGSITAHSPGPWQGAIFSIELPIYSRSKRRYMKRLLKKN